MGSNNGLHIGSPILQANSLVETDSANRAVDYNGINGAYTSLGTSIGNGLRTVSCIINAHSLSATLEGIVYRNNGTNNNNYGIRIDNGTIQFFRYISTVAYSCVSDLPIVAGETYHIVGTIDPVNGMALYINGVKQTSTDPTTNVVGTNTDVSAIGNWGDGDIDREFTGIIDEVALFTTALTDNEVSTLYEKAVFSNLISGTVLVKNVPQQRWINIYKRSDGSWVSGGYSDPVTGYYEFQVPTNEIHFAVILENEAEQIYNSQVRDLIIPDQI